MEHLLRFHPEFQGVVVYESDDAEATVEDWRPTWTNRTAGASLWPCRMAATRLMYSPMAQLNGCIDLVALPTA